MRSIADLPAGTVTFLFTDIEDSTGLLHDLGPHGYGAALSEHRRILRDAFATYGGAEVDTQGDAFFVAFPVASDAVAAARDAQRALATGPIRVRMGLHTGAGHLEGEGYVGADVHLGARIAAAAHGGQVLLSRSTFDSIADSRLTADSLDLGEHRLKGFAEPVWIFQLDSQEFPPIRTISNTNLPRPASSFVGRTREVDDISKLLQDSVRLVTLTGPGGTGKTRLAIESAAQVTASFRNGVFWVGLSALRDPSLVHQTIGETIGAKSSVAEHIANKSMLLVLDNLEQVIDSASDLSSLLMACPKLRLLVTSRELLRVDGEVEYPVAPLAGQDGVRLFCERSGLPSDETIAELCGRLDNLPLVIELAAARARVMSAAQILERLSTRLDLLKGGRDVDARQQTLRATIAWSHDLLNADEQRLFARLAVFTAGSTLEAAEAVADADIDVLQSLADKSLVRAIDGRFRMLETIRQFGTERLEASGEAEQVRRRHAEYFLELAAQAENEINGPQQDRWWQILTDESENMRAALTWSCGGEDPRVCLRLTALLWRYWWQRGHYREGREWYEAALAQADDQPEGLRARTVYGLANMALGTGESDEAIGLLEECLSTFQREGDVNMTTKALTDIGIAHMDGRRFDEAKSFFEQVLEIDRAHGDARRIGIALINLSEVAMATGDLEHAATWMGEALAALRDAGDDQSLGSVLGNLSQLEVRRGNLDAASEHLRHALLLALKSDDRYALAHLLISAGALIFAMGHDPTAVSILAGAQMLRDEMGVAIGSSEADLYAGALVDLRGRLDQPSFEAAWERGRSRGLQEAIAEVLAAVEPSGNS